MNIAVLARTTTFILFHIPSATKNCATWLVAPLCHLNYLCLVVSIKPIVLFFFIILNLAQFKRRYLEGKSKLLRYSLSSRTLRVNHRLFLKPKSIECKL